MNYEEEIKKLILNRSRNGGDYVPDYRFDRLAKHIDDFIKSLLKKQVDKISFDKLRAKLRKADVSDFSLGLVIHRVRKELRKDIPEPESVK